jgi:hypothetical protein
MNGAHYVPTYRIAFPPTGVSPAGTCVWTWYTREGKAVQRERGYRFDTAPLRNLFLSPLPSELADLLDVAMAVYTADRLSPRRIADRRAGDRGWQRSLEVHIPVRDPIVWTAEAVRLGLQRVLAYFTEDQWELVFYGKLGPRSDLEQQGILFTIRFDAEPAVCLFSGGLDSLAGAADQLQQNATGHLICLAGSTSNWIGSVQADLAAALARRFADRATLVRVPFELGGSDPDTLSEEASQRARAFVHLALGATGAVLAGSVGLSVYENGVGALNLPYTGEQFGSQMTRAMHPLALADTAKWLSAYLGRPFSIRGTMLGRTKAQACQSIVDAGLGDWASRSFSCDGFQRVAGQPQCGMCASCLLRRQALHAAGLSAYDSGRGYRFDVTDPSAIIPSQHFVWLHLMLDQVSTLRRCLAAPDPWSALIGCFPMLLELDSRASDWSGVGGPRLPGRTIPALYGSYVREWEQFPVGALQQRLAAG